MTEWNKEKIIALLETNDLAVGRALIVILANQTTDEVQAMDTKHHNGKGFNAPHARMGTSMGLQAKNRNGCLSPKQVDYWRVRDRKGNMRIGIYWKQLLEAIKEKQVE
jgi:hypothetical protein